MLALPEQEPGEVESPRMGSSPIRAAKETTIWSRKKQGKREKDNDKAYRHHRHHRYRRYRNDRLRRPSECCHNDAGCPGRGRGDRSQW